ncbi:hypothetical protein ACWCPX_32955 [Streptomyces olivaceoviridis]
MPRRSWSCWTPDTTHLASPTCSKIGVGHRLGIGHRLGFATEIPHWLCNSYVQRADLVARAPAAGVPVLLVEIDRRTEDAHDLVNKLRRYRK